MDRHHKDWNFWKKLGDLPGNVQPVQIGHLKIEQNHVRRVLPHSLDCFSPGTGFVANLPGALLFEEGPEIVAYRRVVIYHQNSDQTAHPFQF
jgi:hypothetical protein